MESPAGAGAGAGEKPPMMSLNEASSKIDIADVCVLRYGRLHGVDTSLVDLGVLNRC